MQFFLKLFLECNIKNFRFLFQTQVNSAVFVSYICIQVLPHLSLINLPDGGDVQLQILKYLAELVMFCGALDKPENEVQQLYNTLIVSLKYYDQHVDC